MRFTTTNGDHIATRSGENVTDENGNPIVILYVNGEYVDHCEMSSYNAENVSAAEDVLFEENGIREEDYIANDYDSFCGFSEEEE
jgi:hypothetical protein